LRINWLGCGSWIGPLGKSSVVPGSDPAGVWPRGLASRCTCGRWSERLGGSKVHVPTHGGTMYARLKPFLTGQLAHFDRDAIWSDKHAWDGIRVFLRWAIPASFLVELLAAYPGLLPEQYLRSSLLEAVGTHLWNLIGTMGLVLFSLSILFPRATFIATWAEFAFANAFAMGALSIGVMAPQFYLTVANAPLATWQSGAIAAFGTVLICEIALINFTIWCASGWMSSGHGIAFRKQVSFVDWRLRLCAASLMLGLVLTLFFAQS